MTTLPRSAPRVPALPGHPVIGAAVAVQRDYLGTLVRAADQVGGLARIVAGPPGYRMTLYSVSTPELVFEVLGHPDRFTKDVHAYDQVRWAFGNGMLTSDGETWHRQRRFLAPMFTARRIAADYASIMAEEAERLVERWREVAATGAHLDVHAEMVELTSRIIGRILFGTAVTAAVPQLEHFRAVNDGLLRRVLNPHPVPTWIPTPANRRLATGLAAMRDLVADIIAKRRAEPTPPQPRSDLLDLLLTARHGTNTKDRLSDAEVADQILIFWLAGHDTTASTLACLLVELAKAPDWQSTIRGEARSVLNGRAPAAADVPHLVWTGRAAREAMRLYPAAHTIGRGTAGAQVLAGYAIPAGSTVVVSPWAIHRSSRVWDRPDEFDPRRFDVPAGEHPGGHRFAWIPFGAGPRTCVGMQLAMLEVPVVLATILQHFQVTTPVTRVPLQPAISLHPAEPLPIRLAAAGSS